MNGHFILNFILQPPDYNEWTYIGQNLKKYDSFIIIYTLVMIEYYKWKVCPERQSKENKNGRKSYKGAFGIC